MFQAYFYLTLMSYVVVKPLKNKGTAVLLVFLFAGFGLFYSSILGGIIMGLVTPIAVLICFVIGIVKSTALLVITIIFCLLYYIICFIWAIVAVNKYNENILHEQRLNASYHSPIESGKSTTETLIEPYPFEESKADTKKVWIIILAIISVLLLGLLLFNNKRKSGEMFNLSALFSGHTKEEKEIEDQLKNAYLNLTNGIYSTDGVKGLGSDGLPFYNTSSKSFELMGLLPMAKLFGNIKVEAENVKISEFSEGGSTANLKYEVYAIFNNDTTKATINMVTKKIGDKWKFDAEKFFAITPTKEGKKAPLIMEEKHEQLETVNKETASEEWALIDRADEKQVGDYRQKTIINFMAAEDEGDFTSISQYASAIEQFHDLKKPSLIQLKKRYEHIWNIAKNLHINITP
jgi:hypothetical protein